MTTKQWADAFTLVGSFIIDTTSATPADGMAIIIQNGPNSSLLGGSGGSMGYLGYMPNSVALRFDTYNSGAFASMGMLYNGVGTILPSGTTSGTVSGAGEVSTNGFLNWASGSTFAFTINYAASNFSISITEQKSGGNTLFTSWNTNILTYLCPGVSVGCQASLALEEAPAARTSETD